jgi:hypothetical protein
LPAPFNAEYSSFSLRWGALDERASLKIQFSN